MDIAQASTASGAVRAGARIANACGSVGTIGCVAWTRDTRAPVILTAQHVLFGAGARAGEPWSLLDVAIRGGRTRHGRRGVVRHQGADTYVDCAIADIDPRWQSGAPPVTERAGPVPAPGDTVVVRGPTLPMTRGTVIATDHAEVVRVAGVDVEVCGQIAIRASARGRPVTTAGDSGAALLNERGEIVGLVWGFAANGAALACPIAPVLWVLNLELASITSPEAA